MDASKIKGNINPDAPVKSTRIRVGRSINGFGLSPGITKEQRLEVENLMKNAFEKLSDDLAGKYFPLLGNVYFLGAFSAMFGLNSLYPNQSAHHSAHRFGVAILVLCSGQGR